MRQHVEAAFIDLPQGDAADPVVIRMSENSLGTFRIAADGQPSLTARSPNQALGSLATSITRVALDADPDRLHLHCAAVALDGRGLVVTASSGTGKTTLAAKLLTHGWAYGSDEAVALRPASRTVAAYAKPLMIKDGGRFPVHEVARHRVDVDSIDDKIWTVPASAMGVDLVEQLEPACVVILSGNGQQPSHSHSPLVPIHPTDAVVSMMEQTMDAGRFGPEAVDLLAALAARSHCVQMQVGPLETAAEELQEAVSYSQRPRTVGLVEALPMIGLPWHVSENARSVLIDERVVIHETVNGTVCALDDAATASWLTLLGHAPEGWDFSMLQNPAIHAFLEQLIALGLVHAGESHSRRE